MENSNNTAPNNKKGLGLVLTIIILAILIGIGIYFLKPKTPKDVFISSINTAVNESNSKSTTKDGKTNTTMTLSGNIASTDSEVQKVAQYINEGKLTLNVQTDTKAKKTAISADVEYQNDKLLSGKIYYANDDNVYVYVQDLFDKYFKFKAKDVLGEDNQLSSLIEQNSVSIGEKINQSKADKIFEKTLSDNLKDEYFSKESVDGTTKFTMKLTFGEFRQIFVNICTSLKDNQEFINCYKEPDEVKKTFETAINSLNTMEKDYDNYNMEISLYGNTREISKVELKLMVSDQQAITVTINKKDKNNYEVVLDNVPKLGRATLNIEIKEDGKTDLDNIDVSNSVDINNLSQADSMKLYSNLMNMKIYKLIAPMMMMN